MAHFLGRILCLVFIALYSGLTFANDAMNIPILVYHNFNPTRPGSMNLTPKKFEAHLQWLKANGYTVVPLKEVVSYLQGTRTALPEKSVVITADDGWQSDYTYLYPLVKKYHIPVTLFIYPETISNGKNALTWAELKELQDTGLFDIQAHTYSHPNFKHEKKQLSSEKFAKFVKNELVNSKKILEEKMNKHITLLAWPFGIYNDYLEQAAKDAGYTMAFTIDARTANKTFQPMAQPRFMMIEAQSMKNFITIVNEATHKTKVATTLLKNPSTQ